MKIEKLKEKLHKKIDEIDFDIQYQGEVVSALFGDMADLINLYYTSKRLIQPPAPAPVKVEEVTLAPADPINTIPKETELPLTDNQKGMWSGDFNPEDKTEVEEIGEEYSVDLMFNNETPFEPDSKVEEVITFTNHDEPKKPEPLFEPNQQVCYDNETYLYYDKADEVLLMPDIDKFKKIDWLETFKDMVKVPLSFDENEFIPTSEEMVEILNTEISFNGFKGSKLVTIVNELNKGINKRKLKELFQKATDTWRKEKEQSEHAIELTEHQKGVFNNVIAKIQEIMALPRTLVNSNNQSPAAFMTVFQGAAGTGKTTTMGEVLKTLNKLGYTTCFCSPTHQALGVIRETLEEQHIEFTEDNEESQMLGHPLLIKTLASFLGLKMKRDLENGTETFVTDKNAQPIKVDILCIDEASMISKDQIKILIERLNVDFKMILFVGDEPQLPSPSDGNEPNGVFQLPYNYELTEVVRQAPDGGLLAVAHMIRKMIVANNCSIPPSQLITANMTNGNDVFVYNDQNQFLQHYFQDEDESKIITTYTNAITNEYNQYIRSLAVTNQIPGTKLDIVCNGDSYLEDKGKEGILSYITDWADYREFYPGEKIIIGEVNQNGGNIIHQNGETITINRVEILEHTEFVTMPSLDLMAQPTTQEIKFQFYKITDTNAKVVNVVPKESFPAYQDCIQLLKQEAENNQGAKARWKRFYTFKEKFTNVNTMFAATLYKLQGSTYHDLYADIRDLDKFFKWNPVIVYKLLYVAFTRPKKKGIILI